MNLASLVAVVMVCVLAGCSVVGMRAAAFDVALLSSVRVSWSWL